jgi:hypothetical protein
MTYNVFNCNWVDTRWQQNSTHLHTNNTQNTDNGTHITINEDDDDDDDDDDDKDVYVVT